MAGVPAMPWLERHGEGLFEEAGPAVRRSGSGMDGALTTALMIALKLSSCKCAQV